MSDNMQKHDITFCLNTDEYDDFAQRSWVEEKVRHELSAHCASEGVALLDGAVGQWELLHDDDPNRIPICRYKLVGYSFIAGDVA